MYTELTWGKESEKQLPLHNYCQHAKHWHYSSRTHGLQTFSYFLVLSNSTRNCMQGELLANSN